MIPQAFAVASVKSGLSVGAVFGFKATQAASTMTIALEASAPLSTSFGATATD